MNIKISVLLLVIIFFLFNGFTNSSIKKHNTNDSEKLILSIYQDSIYGINASIFNNSEDSIKIVLPGDGSKIGWRTPILRWSVIKVSEDNNHPNDLPEYQKGLGRCGNMNELKIDEIVTINPKSTLDLKGRIGVPRILGEVGSYSVKLYFLNDPNYKVVKRKYSNPKIDKIIQTETREFLLISNELIIEKGK